MTTYIFNYTITPALKEELLKGFFLLMALRICSPKYLDEVFNLII